MVALSEISVKIIYSISNARLKPDKSEKLEVKRWKVRKLKQMNFKFNFEQLRDCEWISENFEVGIGKERRTSFSSTRSSNIILEHNNAYSTITK